MTTKPSPGERLFSMLRRETSGQAFIPQIDGLRFFAIAAVIVSHLNLSVAARVGGDARATFASHASSMGFIGVQLFFVISGFVLGLPFASNRMSGGPPVRLGKYFLRRLTRLEPPYVISLVIIAAYHILRHKWDAELSRHFFATLFYTHNAIYHDHSPVNVVTWSLEVEVQFYILAPLLASVFRISRVATRRAVICAVIVAFSALQYALGNKYEMGLTVFHQLQNFFVGFLLVDLHLNEWREKPTRRGLWDAVSTLSWMGVVAVLFGPRPLPFFLEPWLILIAYVAAFRGNLWERIVRSPVVFTIGGMCYSLYLYHYTIIGIVSKLTARFLIRDASYLTNLIIQGIIIIPFVLALSTIAFVLFEKPFMRRDWPQRLAERFRTPARSEDSAPRDRATPG